MKYAFFNPLIVRTPVFSFIDFHKIDYRSLVKSDLFKIALYIASVDFYHIVEKKDFDYDLLSESQKNTIKKYCNRASFRPTPFGAFSTVASVHWSEEKDSICFDPYFLKMHFKVDYYLSLEICENIIAAEGQEEMIYKSNPSFYSGFDHVRYIKYDLDTVKNKRLFSINSFIPSEIIERVIEFCATGKSRRVIKSFLVTITGSNEEGIDRFINQLTTQQIILPQTGSNITGNDGLEELIEHLRNMSVRSGRLDAIDKLFEKLNKLSIGEENNIVECAELLLEIMEKREALKNPFYVISERCVLKGGLDKIYQQKILDGLHCVDKLVGSFELPALENFKQRFIEKFEHRKIPLLMALDPEIGVGYDNLEEIAESKNLTKDIDFELPGASLDEAVTWTGAHTLLLDKMLFQKKGAGRELVMELTESDLDSIKVNNTHFEYPPTISVVFRTHGDYVYIENAGGSTATALLGRFSPINGNINSAIKEIAEKEQENNSSAVFAEICHVCNTHIANINRRSHVRDYEIPIIIASTLEDSSQIPLNDLFISINAENKIELTSMRLKTTILPRLSSAFNYLKSEFSVFRFLCDMQYQGLKTNFKLELGSFFPGLKFYPRVVYNKAILSLATWEFEAHDIEFVKKLDQENWYACFLEVAESVRLSDQFALIQHDNYLVFDKNEKSDIDLFLSTVKNFQRFTLQEFIVDASEDYILKHGSTQKPMIGQYIASLYKEQDIVKTAQDHHFSTEVFSKQFYSGTPDCLYFKIYCHPRCSDELLKDIVLPLVDELKELKLMDKWFFIRYNDPDYHIRFRLFVKEDLQNEVSALVGNKLRRAVVKMLVYRFYISSYERELERYTSELFEEVESHFFRSSEILLHYLKIQANDNQSESEVFQLEFILLSIEEILSSFNFSKEEKAGQLQVLFENFYAEMGGGKGLKKNLEKKYSKLRPELNTIYGNIINRRKDYGNSISLFQLSVKELSNKITETNYNDKHKIIGDIIHMHLNRLFVQEARKQELVIYYLLFRHYKALCFTVN